MTNLEHISGISILTLNNPPENYLLEPEFIDKQSLCTFIKENKSKSLIIKGAGRNFSAGADIKSIKQQIEDNSIKDKLSSGKDLLNFIYDLNIPVISAIEGVCFGGGLEIALASHIRVASEKAMLAFPESIHNLMPGLGGSYAVKRFMTMGKSIDMILCGNIMPAKQAYDNGLIDFICNPKNSFEYSFDMAKKMTDDKPLEVINNIVKALKNAYELDKNDALKEETKLFCELAKDLK